MQGSLRYICAILLSLLFDPCYSQSDSAKRTVVEKGQHSINAFIGTNLRPGTISATVKAALVVLDKDIPFSASSPGTFAGSYEYMVNDELGLGLEGSYTKTTLSFPAVNYTVNGVAYTDDFWVDLELTRVFARLSYHFSKAEKFDAYAFMGAGYKSSSAKLRSTNSAHGLYEALGGEIKFKVGSPIGMKPGIGLRYFFIRNLALSMEIAGGTPLVCGGLTIKI